MSQFTVETYFFADGRCLFKQPQSVIYYTIGINITRRFQKSVGASVCPLVTLTKKPTPPSLLTIEK